MESMSVQTIAQVAGDHVERVIVGKRREVQLVLVSLLCQGHILLEDVPGVGKTVLAKTISRTIGCSFKRIQFTPDLLPSDVTGVSMYNQHSGTFEFRPGPVFAQLVLADEVNRASPKTQSALLEAMEERQVTVDGTTHRLPAPFVVMATQNPIEYEGTFPLPEAQLDRFLVRLSLGYPGHDNELELLTRQHTRHPLDALPQALDVEQLVVAQEAVKRVHVAPAIAEYIVGLVEATRAHEDIYLGASPRGSLALYNTARAWAAISGRDYVIPDDVKALAEPTLAHRLIVSPSARMRGIDGRTIMGEVLHRIAVPGAQPRAAHAVALNGAVAPTSEAWVSASSGVGGASPDEGRSRGGWRGRRVGS